MGDGDHPGARAEQRLEGLDKEIAVVVDRAPADHRTAALAVEMPGHDVGVMLEDRQDDLVTLPDHQPAEALRHQIDRLGRIAGEDDLAGRGGIEKAADRLPRLLVSSPSPALDRKCRPRWTLAYSICIGLADRLDHRLWLLRRGGIVEIGQGLAIDLPLQNREVGANRLDIIGLRRSVSHCRPSLPVARSRAAGRASLRSVRRGPPGGVRRPHPRRRRRRRR